MPPPRAYLAARKKNGKELLAVEVYERTWVWLHERGCAHLIPAQILEQYAMAISRWIQCEECITEYGFLAKHSTTGNAIPSPYVSMSQSFFKIFVADAAIRNAVLMIDDVLSDERELRAMVETTVYKHIVSFYQGSTAQIGYFIKAKDNRKEVDVVIELPREKILCEVKYRNNSHIPASDAIVELCRDKKSKVTNAFLVTKQIDDFGIAKRETAVPIMRIPAIAFLYLLGKAEADGQNGKM